MFFIFVLYSEYVYPEKKKNRISSLYVWKSYFNISHRRNVYLKPSLILPREKLQLYGVQSLQFHELIAIIIGNGTKGKGVLEIAKEVEALFLNIKKKEELRLELKKLHGVGAVNQMKALAIYELMCIWNTLKFAHDTDKIIVTTPEEVVHYFRSHFTYDQEILLGVYLDTQNKVIACEKLFVGTIDSVEIHPREIFSHALYKSAKSIIIMHNHPSGNPKPSKADIDTTKTLASLGATLGIPIIDHIIVTEKQFVSLKRESYF